jgi:transcriptional regulator with XRE-family HTH domain
VAQLAGVGVTWYTWLEQGRPINASVQVLDAVAQVLRLSAAERWHLYRLAEVPGVPRPRAAETVPAHIVEVMGALEPNPAAAYNGRYDLLACNESYAALFPGIVAADGIERNALWQIYANPAGMSPIDDADVCGAMIATLRANYANHVGDPEWTDLIDELCAVNGDFAAAWSTHPIAEPGPPVTKAFTCNDVGTVRVRATGFTIPGTLDSRMVVYLPDTAADAAAIAELRRRAQRSLRPA